MGIIPQITCRNCRKKYSGLLSKCPHCGAKKNTESQRTPTSAGASGREDSTGSPVRGETGNVSAANTRWQMIFGIILLAAVIIAVIVLISLSINGEGGSKTSPSPSIDLGTPSPTIPPTPTPSPTPYIESIMITYYGSERKEFSLDIGAQIPLQAAIYPLDDNPEVTWRSDNDEICTVDQDGLVNGVSTGWTSIYAECGGVSQECKVYVNP